MATQDDWDEQVAEVQLGRKLVELPHRPTTTGEQAEGVGTALGASALAVYAIALLVMCLVGVAGIVASTLALIQPGNNRYSELKAGSLVEVWRLAPLRDVGLLGFDQVPAAWHDESAAMDGSTACGLLDDALIRVADGAGARLPFAEITAIAVDGVEKQGTVVTARGSGSPVACTFGPDEGGERFERQLRAETGLQP